MKKYTDGVKTVKARNYQEAGEKLYGQQIYHIPNRDWDLWTTYVTRHNGYATVKVYNVGDKQGTYWGVEAADPVMHKIWIEK